MNAANKITVLRIILIPIFVLTYYIFKLNSLIPGILFIFAASTDFLDGYIARKYEMVTTFGKFLDPLVDKMLTQAAFILLASTKHIEAWIVIVIVSREFIINGLRILAASENITIAASYLGKVKTTLQFVAIILLLFSETLFRSFDPIIFTISIYLCLIFTILSGLDYLIKNQKVLKLDEI